ncbi:NAD(P)-binding protein [Trichodelitschia bisporula]|uniref:NAD(P)-binding protein n=1 Tax=Trichodelitschia bisporula TaxID=703511 RepID=A0A6G1I760_9PEZI|nr:NAD(P)-binding protein [Trichodelitschia bisporula]
MDAATDPALTPMPRSAGPMLTRTSHHTPYPFISPSASPLPPNTIVLITGASKGIGRALAIAYTQAGCSGLVLAARGSLSDTEAAVADAAAKEGVPVPKILGLGMDVADADSVAEGAGRVDAAFPEGIDVVVSNAGWLEPEAHIGASDAVEWARSLSVNLTGHYLVTRTFLPLLTRKTGGLKSVLLMTSIGAHLVLPGMSAYNIAKLGVCRFGEYVAVEYGPQGVTAIAIHPGGVATEMGNSLPEEKRVHLVDDAELVAETAVWLSRGGRAWLNGRYVSVQWDMEELERNKEKVVEGDLLKVKLSGVEGALLA